MSKRVCAGRQGVLAALLLGAMAPVLAAPPGPGTIFQQTAPTTQLPTSAPSSIVELPEHSERADPSGVEIGVKGITLAGNQLIDGSLLMPLVRVEEGAVVTTQGPSLANGHRRVR